MSVTQKVHSLPTTSAGVLPVGRVGIPADVLAVTTDTAPWTPAVHVATALAARWGSLLTGCFVDASLRMLQGPESEPSVLGLLMDTPLCETEESAAFRAFAREHGVAHASWVVAHTGLARVLRELSAWNSLAVLERDLVDDETMAEVLGEALLTCRLPSLILPPDWKAPAQFRRVLIAWDGSIEATRAIHAALPFLQEAERVVLLDGGRRHVQEGQGYAPRFEPFLYLSRQEIEVDPMCVTLPTHTAGAGLLDKAAQVGADLVVMGAFGHSLLRERTLGGATRYVLRHASMPVFLQH